MAKKIDTKLEKRIKALGINAKNEEDARKKLVSKLESEGIDGMDGEELDTLVEMVESFVEDAENQEEEMDDTAAVDTEDEADDIEDLADEVEAEDSEESEDDATDESDDEEEDDEPAPAPKKATKKVTEKPAKKETKKAEPKKETKKETKKAEPKKVSKRGVKLDPKNNEDDRNAFAELQELFGEGYQLDWLSSYGLTVKHIGKNGKRGVLTLENATKHDDGRITCNLYLLTMTKETDKLDDLGIDYELCWTKAPFMKGITLEEALEILKKVFEIITGFASTVDKRLGDNRKKMEDNLKKSGKKVASKAKVEDDEEDDEEEDDEPAKKPAKKVTKKAKK